MLTVLTVQSPGRVQGKVFQLGHFDLFDFIIFFILLNGSLLLTDSMKPWKQSCNRNFHLVTQWIPSTITGNQSCKTFPSTITGNLSCKTFPSTITGNQSCKTFPSMITGNQSYKTFPFDYWMDSFHNDRKAVMHAGHFFSSTQWICSIMTRK